MEGMHHPEDEEEDGIERGSRQTEFERVRES